MKIRTQWLAVVAAMPMMASSAGQAQISIGATPTVRPPTGQPVRVEPSVVRIAAVGTNPCRIRNSLFIRGETPPLLTPPPPGARPVPGGIARPPAPASPAQVIPYAEVLAGEGAERPRTGLRMVGPLMQNIRRAELVLPGRPPQAIDLLDAAAPSAQCERQFGSGNGAVTLAMTLPDVTSVTRAQIRLYGHARTLGSVAGEPSGPPPLAAEVQLVIHPHPQLFQLVTPDGRFSGADVRVGGRVQIRGRNLDRTVLPDNEAGPFSAVQLVSRTATEWTANLFRDFPTPGFADLVVQPQVRLMRGAAPLEVVFWDTSLTGQNILLDRLAIRFERRAAGGGGGGAPPPPPPPAALIDGFDPGNLLYIASGGTTTVGNLPGESDQVLTGLASQNWCATVPVPQPSPDGTRTVAQGVAQLGPINWGIRNRGNALFNGTVTAELRLGNRVVDRLTFTGALQPGATQQRAFQRPIRQANVARESLGPVCYHVGTDRDPVVENAGYTIHITAPGNETEAIRSRN